MFSYFNQLFYDLKNNLSKDEHKLLRSMISGVLTNANKDYLNFIGELATLNTYMATGLYNLIRVEERVLRERNVSIDIYLRQKATIQRS